MDSMHNCTFSHAIQACFTFHFRYDDINKEFQKELAGLQAKFQNEYGGYPCSLPSATMAGHEFDPIHDLQLPSLMSERRSTLLPSPSEPLISLTMGKKVGYNS